MLLAFCEILAFKSFKCWVRWKRKSRKCCTHFFLFWKHFDIFEIPRKVRFGIGKGWPWISVRQDAMYQLCGVVKMCVKFTNGWMNLAISHDVRNIHSYFGKGRRQKHNLLLSCPQATHTHKLEQAVCFYLEGVVSRFSLTVQRVRRLGNLVCRKNTLTHKGEINWDTSWSSGTHTLHCRRRSNLWFSLAFFSSHYTHNFTSMNYSSLWFPFCYFTQDTDHIKKFRTRKFADF